MGTSDAPGWFFVLAVVSGATAAFLFARDVATWPWGLALIAVIAAGANFAACIDAAHVTCPKCGLKPSIRPWSF